MELRLIPCIQESTWLEQGSGTTKEVVSSPQSHCSLDARWTNTFLAPPLLRHPQDQLHRDQPLLRAPNCEQSLKSLPSSMLKKVMEKVGVWLS